MTVPRLRFPGFVGKWEEKRLGPFFEEYREKSSEQDQFDVLTSARSGLLRQKDYYDNDRITDRDNIGFNIIPPNYLTYRSRSDDRRFFFNENDLGITGIISVYYPVFRVKMGENKFFVELLARHTNTIGKYSVGTSQTVLSMNELKRIKLPLPMPPEQKKIAAFLVAVDAKIEALRARVEGMQTYKRGLMQALFSQRLRFTQPDGTAFPDWQEKRLGAVAVITKGQQLNRDTLYPSGRYPVINGGITPSGYNDEYNTQARTITISEGGNSCGFVGFQKVPFWSGGHCYALTPDPKHVLNNFLYQGLKFSEVSIMRLRVGSGLPNIQKGDLGKFAFPLPNLDEQQEIATFLSATDAKIEAVANQVTQMQTFKKGLLQQMFL